MNVPECVFYCLYLYIVRLQIVDWSYESFSRLEVKGKGKGVNLAVLLAFSGAVMTLSKTLLYCEYSLGSCTDTVSPNDF